MTFFILSNDKNQLFFRAACGFLDYPLDIPWLAVWTRNITNVVCSGMSAIRFRDILMKIAQIACSRGGNVPNNRHFFDSERMQQNRLFVIFRLI